MTLTPGTRVRIRALMPPGHIRTPAYLRGREGQIERALGRFGNPEERAYGRTGDTRDLYRIRFRMGDLWDDAEAPDDTLDAEIYAHWIEPLED